MPQITPYFDDPRDLTHTANTAVVGGKAVMRTAGFDRRIDPATAATTAFAGVPLDDAAIGAKVTVSRGQVLPVTADGAIVAGNKLVVGASQNFRALAAEGAGAIVGEALENASNGTVFRALIY